MLLLVGLAGLLSACGGSAAGEGGAGSSATGTTLTVDRGDFQDRKLLTGELRARQAVDLVVPKMPSWQVQLSWMVEDGSQVSTGDPVIEFDSSQFTSDLEERRLALRGQENEYQRLVAQGEVERLEKSYVIEQKRTELEKATTRADVPADLLADRDFQERQLALRTAELELAKAEADLQATETRQAAEREIKAIEIETARREIIQAEAAVEAMTLTAPQDGIFVVQDHMWEPRKLNQGDMVHRGHTVARLPVLSSMEVRAALSDVDDRDIASGMEGDCVLDAYPDRSFPCRVTAVSPVARESNRNSLLRFFDVRLDLLADDPGLMRPGMSVRASVVTDLRRDVLLAPRSALTAATGEAEARLQGGGSAEVTLGPCNAQVCVVEAGLEAGQRLARAPVGPGVGAAGGHLAKGSPESLAANANSADDRRRGDAG